MLTKAVRVLYVYSTIRGLNNLDIEEEMSRCTERVGNIIKVTATFRSCSYHYASFLLSNINSVFL